MENINCSIVIVNYNTCDLTLQCIQSVVDQSSGFTYEIIVVDNASTDNSAKILSELKHVKYIQNTTNAGFGAANNLGVKNASGTYIFLLNSDTILIENSIKKLLDFYSSNEDLLKLGALGCILIDENHNIINSGSCYPTTKYFLKSYLRLPIKDFVIQKDKKYQTIDFVTGADLFISKEKYNKIGGFDENFFLYFEETDLQKRINLEGYFNYILNTTEIIHLEGGSDGGNTKISNFKRMVIEESKIRFLKKHDPFYFLFFMIDFPVVVLRLLKNNYTVSENKMYLKNTIKAYFKK